MDSDTHLDYALFQLSPRRSRCELFVSGNGTTEKIASGFLKPFVTHLKVAEEQDAKAVNSIKLNVERTKNDGTWFKKGTLERFVWFVSTPEVLELVNTFDAEMAQLEGAKRIYSQGARDPLSGSLGENETTIGEAADITRKELLKAIDLRLVAIKQDLTAACSQASYAGFTPDNVSELLCFADYFGANRLNEACTKFISLGQRHPELINLQHQPQSMPLQLKSIDNRNALSSSTSDMSVDQPNVAGKPTDCSGLHLHKPSDGQPARRDGAELLGTYRQLKPVQQIFIGRAVEKVMDDPIPAASATKPAHQDGGGGSRRISVQDRINLFESKQKEQSLISNNISSNVGVKKLAAGKGDQRRLPSDVLDKSLLRRWSGASDVGIDISSSSFSDRKDSGSTTGMPTSANLQLQSSNRNEERLVGGSNDTTTLHSQLGPNECIVMTPSSSLSPMNAQFKAFPKHRVSEKEGNKSSTVQSKPTFPNEQGKHQISASPSGTRFRELSDQDASSNQQNGFSEPRDHAGLKCHATSEDFVQAKDHVTLQVTSRGVSDSVEKDGLRDQEIFMSRTSESSSQPDGVGMKDQPTLPNQFQTLTRKTNDVQAKTKDPSDFQVKSRASSVTYLESQSQGRTSPTKIIGAGGRGTAASEQPFGPILVKTKREDSGHLRININDQSSAPDYMKKLQDEQTHSERSFLPVLSVLNAKECPRLLDPPSMCPIEQTHMVRPLKGGNQELNHELQMKANELENIFAEHKLRIHKNQAATFQRSKPSDVHKDHVLKTLEKEQFLERKIAETFRSEVELHASLLLNVVDNKEYVSNLSQRCGNKSDDFRGNFYDKYMQKRNAKLWEQWKSKRPQKEAKMKEMRDSLELILAQMRAKSLGSAGGKDSNRARHLTEK